MMCQHGQHDGSPSCEYLFREYLTVMEETQECIKNLRQRETELIRKVHALRVENDRLKRQLSDQQWPLRV